MKSLIVIAIPINFITSALYAQSRVPYSLEKCQDAAELFNEGEDRLETVSFTNLRGQPQDLDVQLKMKSEMCWMEANRASFRIEKMGGSRIYVDVDIDGIRRMDGGIDPKISVKSTNCEIEASRYLHERLRQGGWFINDAVSNNISLHVAVNFCPKLIEKVQASVSEIIVNM